MYKYEPVTEAKGPSWRIPRRWIRGKHSLRNRCKLRQVVDVGSDSLRYKSRQPGSAAAACSIKVSDGNPAPV